MEGIVHWYSALLLNGYQVCVCVCVCVSCLMYLCVCVFPLQALRWRIELEPWASEHQSLEDEARRFLHYITTPQVGDYRGASCKC